MIFDNLFLYHTINEYRELLKETKISKAICTKTSVQLLTKNRNRVNSILISINPSNLGLFLFKSNHKEENKNNMFMTLLTKYIVNGHLLGIEQINQDRVVKFSFSKVPKIGNKKIYYLYVEFMGKHSNIILTDEENKIIGCIKESERILPKFTYEPFINENRESLSSLNENVIKSICTDSLSSDSIDELSKKFAIASKRLKVISQNSESLDDFIKNVLFQYYEFKNGIAGNKKCYLYSNDKKVKFYDVFENRTLKDLNVKEFDTISMALQNYYEMNFINRKSDEVKQKFIDVIKKQEKKLEKKLKNLEKDIVKAKKEKFLTQKADLIYATMHELNSDMREFEIKNTLYPEILPEVVKIANPKKLKPHEVATKLYEKSKNSVNKEKTVKEIIEKTKTDFEKVKKLYGEIELAENETDYIDMIFLIEKTKLFDKQAILNLSKKFVVVKNKNKKEDKSKKLIVDSNSDYTIYCGKNSSQNSYLLSKVAKPNDIWFHIKDYASAHVILKFSTKKVDDLNKIPDEILKSALDTLLKKSKIRAKVLVDFTFCKFVTKVKGAKDGFVTYRNFKSINYEVGN